MTDGLYDLYEVGEYRISVNLYHSFYSIQKEHLSYEIQFFSKHYENIEAAFYIYVCVENDCLVFSPIIHEPYIKRYGEEGIRTVVNIFIENYSRIYEQLMQEYKNNHDEFLFTFSLDRLFKRHE